MKDGLGKLMFEGLRIGFVLELGVFLHSDPVVVDAHYIRGWTFVLHTHTQCSCKLVNCAELPVECR